MQLKLRLKNFEFTNGIESLVSHARKKQYKSLGNQQPQVVMLGLDGVGKTTILNYFTGESNLGAGSSDGLLGDAKTTIGFRVARVTVKKQNRSYSGRWADSS